MKARRFDPDRRNRIINAALDTISEEGVAGATHRKIARRADVPLGSMTYHFEGMDELLCEAFTRFVGTFMAQFEEVLGRAASAREAGEIILGLIHENIIATKRDLVLTHELYALAARESGYRALTHDWMRRSRAALERHFDPATARIIDALVEGLTIHQALATEPHEQSVAAEAMRRIVSEAVKPIPSGNRYF